MRIVATLIDLYSIVVLAAVVMSWVQADRRNPIVQWVYSMTEPVLAPIRRVLPPLGGLDLSPMVLLVVLRVPVAPEHRYIGEQRFARSLGIARQSRQVVGEVLRHGGP